MRGQFFFFWTAAGVLYLRVPVEKRKVPVQSAKVLDENRKVRDETSKVPVGRRNA